MTTINLPIVDPGGEKLHMVVSGQVDGAAHWATHESLFPDVVAITADGYVSVREPIRGWFTWSWRSQGVRQWRDGVAR